MPVKKVVSGGTPIPPPTQSGCSHPLSAHHFHNSGSWGKKLVFTLLGILIVYAIVFLGSLIRNNLKKYDYIGRADRMERTIAVEAEGKVTVKPDIAMTNMGMTVEGKTVAEAQQKNTEIMNKLTARLKDLGIEAKDIQTTYYNIYQQYDYTDDKQTLRGYQVDQNISVKIRNLEIANQVLALAGELSINKVNGLQFTIDEREVYKDQAREIALEKLAGKTAMLAEALGIRVKSIVSYNEYEDFGKGYPYAMMADGMGSGGPPSVEPGTADVVLRVNVMFEI